MHQKDQDQQRALKKYFKKTLDQEKSSESYWYNVVLRFDPIVTGIDAHYQGQVISFTGPGALQNYLNRFLGGKYRISELVNVWEGYQQVVLARFKTENEVNMNFDYSQIVGSIPDVKAIQYRLTDLRLRRARDTESEIVETDLATISIDNTPQVRALYNAVQPFLQAIRTHIDPQEWIIHDLETLHVKIRRYESTQWHGPWQILLDEYPAYLKCVALELVPTAYCAKRIVRMLRSKGIENQWWEGAIRIQDHCSACRTQLRDPWMGYCPHCGEYERVKPIWSTASLAQRPSS